MVVRERRKEGGRKREREVAMKWEREGEPKPNKTGTSRVLCKETGRKTGVDFTETPRQGKGCRRDSSFAQGRLRKSLSASGGPKCLQL